MLQQLIASVIGSTVNVTNKEGATVSYTVAGFDDVKEGKLRDGSSEKYVKLVNGDDVTTIHPNVALKLFKDGAANNMVLVVAAKEETTVTEQTAELPTTSATEQTAELPTTSATEQPTAEQPTAEVTVKEVSRKDKAKAIYVSNAGMRRKDVIAKFISEVGMTKNGAATYYQNFKSGNWA